MAGNTDGEVVIKIDLSSNDAEKEISRLKKRFLSLEEDLTVGQHKKDALTRKLESIDNQIDAINRKKIEFGGSGISDAEAAKLEELTKSANETDAAIQRQNKSLEDTQLTLEGVKLRYAQVTAAAAQAAQAESQPVTEQDSTDSAEVESVNQGLTRTQAVLAHIKEQIKSSFDFSNAKEDVKSLLGSFASMVKKIALFSAKGIFTGMQKGVSGIVSGLKSCVSHIGKIFTGSKSVSKSFSGIGSAIKRIAPALLAVRGVMGILRKAVSAYMEQNQQLSNTLSGAWTNLGNILGPIITRMVNLLANAVAYFTKFLNLLGFTGKAASDQISSAGGTAKKETDELKKQLMSFDELNVLSDNDSDSGGGGSGGDAGITPDVQLPDWAKLMAEQLRSAQWSEAATTLTTALNNMVDSVDWGGIGAKIGYWLNGALTFLATAVKTFDWQNLGAKLAESVNNIVSNVDWTNLGTLLWAKFKIALETLAGFLLNLDMAELARAASNIVIGFINSISETVRAIDWYGVFKQIMAFIAGIDYSGIADAVFEAIGTAFGAAADFLWKFIKDAWSKIVAWWYDTAYEDGQFTFEGLLNGILDVAKNIGAWITDHIFQPFIDGFKSAFGINSPSTVMAEQGGYIIEGMLNGITGAWPNVKNWFSKALADIKQAFSDAWTSIRNTTSNIWNGIVDTIRGAVNGVIGVINRLLAVVTDGVNSLMRLLSFNINIPGLGSVGLNLPQFSAPQIPYLATGAVIPPNAPFAAVLGDQRHGNNIEAPEDLIRKIVREEVAGGASNEEIVSLLQELIEVVMGIKIGDETIGKAAMRYTRRYNRAMGV